ncbi:MAG: hypothetical protein B7Z42_09320 [Brevundimonas sp. 12-68-7]|uniref:Uncharacterized protein n=1 Tax=Brevundimonas subvibrioides TaxID=74313 RepID=A0A258FJZ4_9CAUL|nr:MAG: hypothetical protein B7Z42_09320 [Brevundimonas sp. 12-68-7]OYX32092.1 MAG: hypothetical protein B7Z01_11550 [Brevundimonas subvibrioides]
MTDSAETQAPLTLECFPMTPSPPRMVSGRPERDWMDDFAGRHPYRCLPLTMANTTGWELLCPFGFEAEWDGRLGADAIQLRPDADALHFDHFAQSHFTEGVLTFHTGWMFRTPEGWGMRASGPPNRAKHGIAPLEGVTETDWLPYPFTMNWRFTAPGVIRFEKDEPFCFLQPIPHHRIERFQPVRRSIDDDGDLARQYRKWSEVRTDFNTRMAAGDPEAVKEAWQKFYFRGEFPDRIAQAPDTHVNKRRMSPLPDAPEPAAPARAHVGFTTWSAQGAAKGAFDRDKT